MTMGKFQSLLRICSTLVRFDIAASLVMTATLLLWLQAH